MAPFLFSYPHSGSAQCHTAAEKAPGIKPGKDSKTRTRVQVPAESNKPTATAGLSLDVLKVPQLSPLLRTSNREHGERSVSAGLGMYSPGSPGPRLWQSLDKLPRWPRAQAVILAAVLALDELHFDASSGPGLCS